VKAVEKLERDSAEKRHKELAELSASSVLHLTLRHRRELHTKVDGKLKSY